MIIWEVVAVVVDDVVVVVDDVVVVDYDVVVVVEYVAVVYDIDVAVLPFLNDVMWCLFYAGYMVVDYSFKELYAYYYWMWNLTLSAWKCYSSYG